MMAAPAAGHMTAAAVSMTAAGQNNRIVRTGDERICSGARHCRGRRHRHDRECKDGGADQQ
jgi:hypothetical protein